MSREKHHHARHMHGDKDSGHDKDSGDGDSVATTIPAGEVPLGADAGAGVPASVDKDAGDENSSGDHLSLDDLLSDDSSLDTLLPGGDDATIGHGGDGASEYSDHGMLTDVLLVDDDASMGS